MPCSICCFISPLNKTVLWCLRLQECSFILVLLPLGLLILSSFSVQQQLNSGQNWSTDYVGLNVLNGKVLWASLFSLGAAKSIKYHHVQFTEVDCFDILQKVYFLSHFFSGKGLSSCRDFSYIVNGIAFINDAGSGNQYICVQLG